MTPLDPTSLEVVELILEFEEELPAARNSGSARRLAGVNRKLRGMLSQIGQAEFDIAGWLDDRPDEAGLSGVPVRKPGPQPLGQSAVSIQPPNEAEPLDPACYNESR